MIQPPDPAALSFRLYGCDLGSFRGPNVTRDGFVPDQTKVAGFALQYGAARYVQASKCINQKSSLLCRPCRLGVPSCSVCSQLAAF
jgi:hypothetical protein